MLNFTRHQESWRWKIDWLTQGALGYRKPRAGLWGDLYNANLNSRHPNLAGLSPRDSIVMDPR